MMPMVLERGLGWHPQVLIYCDKQKLYSLTKIPAPFSAPEEQKLKITIHALD